MAVGLLFMMLMMIVGFGGTGFGVGFWLGRKSALREIRQGFEVIPVATPTAQRAGEGESSGT